jgi:two-component system, OmpR family, KDP operon response regulator KdpE
MPVEAPPGQLLVVDDEPRVLEALSNVLEARGYEVRTAASGSAALAAVGAQRPDVVLLDIVMPGMDGVEVCRRLRAAGRVQILVLSAVMDEQHKVRALDAGADDYVTKPFSVEELLARVRSALRRARQQRADEPVINAGGVTMDLLTREVTVDGQDVHLTPTEYELLRVLVSNPDRVLTHRALLHAALGPSYADALDALRTYINQLRRKTEKEPRQPRRIITEPGIGYRFRVGENGA